MVTGNPQIGVLSDSWACLPCIHDFWTLSPEIRLTAWKPDKFTKAMSVRLKGPCTRWPSREANYLLTAADGPCSNPFPSRMVHPIANHAECQHLRALHGAGASAQSRNSLPPGLRRPLPAPRNLERAKTTSLTMMHLMVGFMNTYRTSTDFDLPARLGEVKPSKVRGKRTKKGEVYQCEKCSKVRLPCTPTGSDSLTDGLLTQWYRHPACLTKHRWQHSASCHS